MTLPPDYSMDEVAAALGMSARWVRARVAEGAEHNRYGHKVRFTAEQVEKLRQAHTRNAVPAGVITTGRKKRAS